MACCFGVVACCFGVVACCFGYDLELCEAIMLTYTT